jgi:cellobiose-specific phosphotransferase system component IIA
LLYLILYFLLVMMARNQSYKVAVAIVVLFGASVLVLGNVTPFAFASPSSAGDQGGANFHIDEAMKALDAGDTAGAEMHMGEADKVLQEGDAKMHLGEAIKALQAGDTAGAKMHAQIAQDSL